MNKLNNKIIEDIYNVDYVTRHKLSGRKIRKSGIELLGSDEIFVQYPKWNDYYISSYGRVISTKYNKIELLKPYQIKQGYLFYKLVKVTHGKQRSLCMPAQRLVADVFLPNFWKDQIQDRKKLQAHHMDKNKKNNYYKNIALLPIDYHHTMERVKAIYLLSKDGKVLKLNLYDLMAETGLTIDEIVLATKSEGLDRVKGNSYLCEVKGHLIMFQFRPKNNKSKKKKDEKSK